MAGLLKYFKPAEKKDVVQEEEEDDETRKKRIKLEEEKSLLAEQKFWANKRSELDRPAQVQQALLGWGWKEVPRRSTSGRNSRARWYRYFLDSLIFDYVCQ
jgi:hypothetical protein